MSVFRTAEGLSSTSYAASIASTWIWAPALFVSSQIAYQYGVYGLLMFLVPNVLTLIAFAYVAQRNSGAYTAVEAVKRVGKAQSAEHLTITTALLIGSTFVQILGIHTIFSQWFGFPRLLSVLLILGICLTIIWKNGLRACIATDKGKYFFILAAGVLIAGSTVDFSALQFAGHQEFNLKDLFLSFGIPTAIGLMTAPYVDTTFWQRAANTERESLIKVFGFAAFLFALVPILFGLVGLSAPLTENWDLTRAVDGPVLRIALVTSVMLALIATVDSNLCAVGGLAKKGWENRTILAFCALITTLFCYLDNLTIVDLFLLYGTLRTIGAAPVILNVFDCYDAKRLQYATGFAMLTCPLGFAFAQPYGYGFIFTVLALLIPFLGYKRKTEFVASPALGIRE